MKRKSQTIGKKIHLLGHRLEWVTLLISVNGLKQIKVQSSALWKEFTFQRLHPWLFCRASLFCDLLNLSLNNFQWNHLHLNCYDPFPRKKQEVLNEYNQIRVWYLPPSWWYYLSFYLHQMSLFNLKNCINLTIQMRSRLES